MGSILLYLTSAGSMARAVGGIVSGAVGVSGGIEEGEVTVVVAGHVDGCVEGELVEEWRVWM